MDVLSLATTILLIVNALLLVANISVRYFYLPTHENKRGSGGKKQTRLLVIVGSGGHTQEMMKLVGALDGDKYPQRSYVVARTDSMGEEKVRQLERKHFNDTGQFRIEKIPRSREVGQSYITSVWTTLVSAAVSLRILWETRPTLLLCNGPGTGLPLCLLASLLSIAAQIGLLSADRECRVVFVESVCRVRSLSLTALILYRLRACQALLVQWPELQCLYPRTRFIGRLV